MTPRITGFSDLRGKFDAMPFDGAIAVRVETDYNIRWSNAHQLVGISAHKDEAWFMLKDMQ